MPPTFHIFCGEFHKAGSFWIESVDGLRDTHDRMALLAAEKPGRYFIFEGTSKTCVATVDTKEHKHGSSARHSRKSLRRPVSDSLTNVAKLTKARSEPDRSLSAAILEAQDNERRKISRELHDSVGQSLVAIKMVLESLDVKLSSDDCKAMNKALCMLDDTTAEIRTLSHLLHPMSLDALGLQWSIGEYARGFQERTGIRTTVKIPRTLPKLESPTETALFRIMQECLTNVHKHARASNLTILIKPLGHDFLLSISDDGIGLPDDLCEGVGLRGMRERVKELGGSFRAKRASAGTSIIARIPLN